MSLLAQIKQSNANINQMWKDYQIKVTEKSPQAVNTAIKADEQDNGLQSMLDEFREQESEKDYTMMSIINKMDSGQELSSEDLQYLQEKNPALYAKAMQIDKEREAFAKMLERCETMDDVRQVYMQKMQGIMGELKAAKKSGNMEMVENIKTKLMAMTKEFGKFIKSEKGEAIQKNDKEAARKELEKIVDKGLAHAEKMQAQEHMQKNGGGVAAIRKAEAPETKEAAGNPAPTRDFAESEKPASARGSQAPYNPLSKVFSST